MNFLILWFYKITIWPFIVLFYRPKVKMYDKKVKRPSARGTIIVSNHYSVYDVPFIIHAFFFRTIYFISGEVLYKKPMLGWWITKIGAIPVNREKKDVGWLEKSEKLLKKGRTILIFPQSKLSPNNEEQFEEAFVILALRSKAPILSIYVSGHYSFINRAKMIIGKKIDIDTLWDVKKNSRENVKDITMHFQNYNKELQFLHGKK